MIREKRKFSRFSRSLRHRITLEKKLLTADGGGGYTASWEEIAVLWAEIHRISGGERYLHGKLNKNVTHLFRMRYRSDISEDMRLCHEGRIFNIISVNNSGEFDRTLDVYAEEGVAV